MSKMGQELEKRLDENKYELYEAIKEIAIPSLRWCEGRYGHDDMARLGLEAIIAKVEGA